jgi:hypothetical protein
MSQTETHIGKLRKIESTESIEKWCENTCISLGYSTKESYYGSWKEKLQDETKWQKYFFYNDSIYEMIEHQEVEDDIDSITLNSDGTYSFIMQFYNGGTNLTEMIEDGIKRIHKTQ